MYPRLIERRCNCSIQLVDDAIEADFSNELRTTSASISKPSIWKVSRVAPGAAHDVAVSGFGSNRHCEQFFLGRRRNVAVI